MILAGKQASNNDIGPPEIEVDGNSNKRLRTSFTAAVFEERKSVTDEAVISPVTREIEKRPN